MTRAPDAEENSTFRQRWLRKRRIIGLICTIIALWLAWQVYDIFTGKPKPSVDYITPFYELTASIQGQGGNGWALYAETIGHIGQVSADGFAAAMAVHEKELADAPEAPEPEENWEDRLEREVNGGDSSARPGSPTNLYAPDFDDVGNGPFDASKWQPHLGIIASLQKDGSLDALARLSRMERLIPPHDKSGSIQSTMPSLQHSGQFRMTIKMEAARLRLTAHDDQWDEFTEVLDESLALVRIAASQPTMLTEMFASGYESLILREVRDSIAEFPPPEAACLNVKAVIDGRLPLPPCTFYLQGEHLYQLDSLQHTYTASGRLPISAWGKYRREGFDLLGQSTIDPVQGAIGDVLAIAIPGHEEAARLTNDVFDEAIEFAKRPLHDRLRGEFVPSQAREQLPMNQVVLREGGLDYFSGFMRGDARMECDTRETTLLLLIEAYRARHGAPPAALVDLVPEFLDAAPTDPTNDQPYGYRLLTDDPHGRAYLLYSLGPDGHDDGGVDSPDWRGPGPDDIGVDRVINRPRHDPADTP